MGFPLNTLMSKVFKFLYDLLLHDFSNDHPSHTKLWSNIGYGVLTWAFIHIVSVGKTEIDYMLFFLFALVVVGNKTLRDSIKKPPSS